MFGHKTSSAASSPQRDDIVVHTIPDMFYGGKNPEIYTDAPAARPVHVKPATPARVSSPIHSRKWIYIGSVGAIILLVVGVSWYYLRGYMAARSVADTVPVRPVIQAPVVVPVVVPSSSVDVVIASSTPTTTESAIRSDIVYMFPTFGLFDVADLDADGMTDMEEAMYGTDPGIWDTDEDGYYDGRELENLYSPTQASPTKIRATATVQEYTNPQFGYRLYYPASWQIASVDKDGKQVLISAATGEYIEIIRSEKTVGEGFADWYSRVIGASARYTDFTSSRNRFAFDYLRRPDWLAAFFESPDAVYTLMYHPGNNQGIVYRRTMAMVLQSFVPFGTAAPLPEQEVLPSTTSTTVQ